MNRGRGLASRIHSGHTEAEHDPFTGGTREPCCPRRGLSRTRDRVLSARGVGGCLEVRWMISPHTYSAPFSHETRLSRVALQASSGTRSTRSSPRLTPPPTTTHHRHRHSRRLLCLVLSRCLTCRRPRGRCPCRIVLYTLALATATVALTAVAALSTTAIAATHTAALAVAEHLAHAVQHQRAMRACRQGTHRRGSLHVEPMGLSACGTRCAARDGSPRPARAARCR